MSAFGDFSYGRPERERQGRAGHNQAVRQGDISGRPRGTLGALTLDQKREIVRRVKGRFESPMSVAKSMGVTTSGVRGVMRSYAAGKFTMDGPS